MERLRPLYPAPMGKTVNGKLYCQNILPTCTKIINNMHVLPCTDMSVLMQDRATHRTAQTMLNQIEQTGVKVWTDLLGNSPDLNQIEHT